MFRKNKRNVLLTRQSQGAGIGQANKQKIKGASARRKKTASFLVKFLGVLFIGSAIYVFLFSSFTQIDNVAIEGYERISRRDIQDILSEKTSGKYGGILEKNNFFLFPKKELIAEMLSSLKLLKRVEIEKKFPNQITIKIFERNPKITLCSLGSCYLADEDGQLFDREENQVGMNVPKIIDEGGKKMKLGDKPLDLEKIVFVTDFFALVSQDLGLELNREIFTPNLSSGDLRVFSKEGWKIFISWELALNKEISMLGLVLENKIEKEKRKDLEYIDIRTLNRAYFRFNDQESDDPASKKE